MLRTVSTRLRTAIRAWLGLDEPVTPVEPRKGLSIAQSVLAKAGERHLVVRKVEAPKLPAGVVPSTLPPDDSMLGPYVALDSEFNAPAYAYAQQFNCGLGFPGYAYLAELSQRSEYRAPSETIASEMTREWIKITVKGKAKQAEKEADEPKPKDNPQAFGASDFAPNVTPVPIKKDADGDGDVDGGLEDKVERINEAFECFKVRDQFCKLAELDGLFGRSQLFIDIDPKGRSPDEVRSLPLVVDKATIPKGSLCGFKVVEPIWTTPYSYNATDPMAADFYKPRAWFVLGKRVHATRLLTFISRDVPDMLKPAYNFGGLSMTQLMESDVFQWLRTRNSVSDLIHNFSVMCLQTDMTDILQGNADKPGGLMDRAKLFTQTRDNQGLTLLDKDREQMVAVNVPLNGLDALQAQAQEHMAAPSHIPLVKLLGITPQGLNASSEGEIKVFYDFVRACQQKLFGEHLKTVLQIIQLHLFGEIDDAIGFEFIGLTAPTIKELAEIRKSNAETDATYVDKGVLAPEEVRERLATDPDSGYNNLSGDAPEMPTLTEMEAQAKLGEQGAQADHERGEESAEAAHERSLKEAAAASKAA